MEDKDFGELLHKLRIKQGLTERELVERLELETIREKNIKKWEKDLELPELNVIYKLSEIFMYSATDLLEAKQLTLKAGYDHINVRFIRWFSYILKISFYTTLWLERIIIGLALIGSFLFFLNAANLFTSLK